MRQRIWRLAPADRGEIVLRHRRIYILPTPRGLALIATLAIMLLTSMNYALSLGYAIDLSRRRHGGGGAARDVSQPRRPRRVAAGAQAKPSPAAS